MPSEFELIARYFSHQSFSHPSTSLGIGDDAAIVSVPSGMELVVAVDTLVEGIHFPVGTEPRSIGYKALAVNLSDLAAMGAEPAWCTLALSMPVADEALVGGIADGLLELASRFCVELIGGDTVRGPLTLSVTVLGLVPTGMGIRRRGSQLGDRIWVSGTLGDAAVGLRIVQGNLHAEAPHHDYLCGRLDKPTPRTDLGRRLRGLAHAAIDISDGLVADVGHLLEASELGARIDADQLPLSQPLSQTVNELDTCRQLALSGGDDYEICFTASPNSNDEIEALARDLGVPLTCIGEVVGERGVRVVTASGEMLPLSNGYDHFREESDEGC